MKGVMGMRKYNQDFSQTSRVMLGEEVTWDVFSRDADIGHLWQCRVLGEVKDWYEFFDVPDSFSFRNLSAETLRRMLREMRSRYSSQWVEMCSWVTKAHQLLAQVFLLRCSVVERRALLSTFNNVLKSVAAVYLRKRYARTKCVKCEKQHWCCAHNPVEPEHELKAVLSRSAMDKFLHVCNFLRSVASLKFVWLSSFHFHEKLRDLFSIVTDGIACGQLGFARDMHVNYFFFSIGSKVTETGETMNSFNERVSQHWRNMMLKRDSAWIPGYEVMCQHGVHEFVVVPLCSAGANATKLQRYRLEQMISRSFQCKGNTPFAQKYLKSKLGEYDKMHVARSFQDGKPMRYKRHPCTPRFFDFQKKLSSVQFPTWNEINAAQLDEIRLKLMRQGKQAEQGKKLVRKLPDKQVSILYRQLFDCQKDRNHALALNRLRSTLQDAQRSVPVHKKFVFRTPFCKTLNVHRLMMQHVSQWLSKQTSLHGMYVSVRCTYKLNPSIEDIACNHKKFGAAFGQEARLRCRQKMAWGDRLRRSCVCACELLKRISVSSPAWDNCGHVAVRFFPDMLVPRLAGSNVSSKTRVEPDFEFVSRCLRSHLFRLGRCLKISGASKAWMLLNSRLQSWGVLGNVRHNVIYHREIREALFLISRHAVVSIIDKSKGELCALCPVLAQNMYVTHVVESDKFVRSSLDPEECAQPCFDLLYKLQRLKCCFSIPRDHKWGMLTCIPKSKDIAQKVRVLNSYYKHACKDVFRVACCGGIHLIRCSSLDVFAVDRMRDVLAAVENFNFDLDGLPPHRRSQVKTVFRKFDLDDFFSRCDREMSHKAIDLVLANRQTRHARRNVIVMNLVPGRFVDKHWRADKGPFVRSFGPGLRTLNSGCSRKVWLSTSRVIPKGCVCLPVRLLHEVVDLDFSTGFAWCGKILFRVVSGLATGSPLSVFLALVNVLYCLYSWKLTINNIHKFVNSFLVKKEALKWKLVEWIDDFGLMIACGSKLVEELLVCSLKWFLAGFALKEENPEVYVGMRVHLLPCGHIGLQTWNPNEIWLRHVKFCHDFMQLPRRRMQHAMSSSPKNRLIGFVRGQLIRCLDTCSDREFAISSLRFMCMELFALGYGNQAVKELRNIIAAYPYLHLQPCLPHFQ